MDGFVNRTAELRALDRWWKAHARAAVVWGRRRVGKTALLQQFASDKRSVFHTGAGRGDRGELALLSRQVAALGLRGLRDLDQRPYTNWDDALDDLAERAARTPVLLVLDEFPELVAASPGLPNVLRAFLDRSQGHTKLRLLLCGSAVRHMTALQEERQPLYGRFDLALLVHAFGPHDAAHMLPRVAPADRALAYGLTGGMPLYLSWWDQDASVTENLAELVCQPASRLLTEGDLVLRTDADVADLGQQVLYAIADGRTQHGEIKDHIRAEPTRTLDRLIELRIIERLIPAGEPQRTKRRIYRIADPFLAFHLRVASRYRSEIDRGLGRSIAPVMRQALDDHMGGVWEEAFRSHLRVLAADGRLPTPGNVVGVGAWWDASGTNEIDAVVLEGRSATPVLAGEAKWARSVDARRIVHDLRQKVDRGLGLDPNSLGYLVCARHEVHHLPDGAQAFTAEDLFSPS